MTFAPCSRAWASTASKSSTRNTTDETHSASRPRNADRVRGSGRHHDSLRSAADEGFRLPYRRLRSHARRATGDVCGAHFHRHENPRRVLQETPEEVA